MGEWHPIMAAVEGPTGTWNLTDSLGQVYGTVMLRRVDSGEVRYKAVYSGQILGWSTRLRLACERVHGAYLAAHGPEPFAGYPDLSGSAARSGHSDQARH